MDADFGSIPVWAQMFLTTTVSKWDPGPAHQPSYLSKGYLGQLHLNGTVPPQLLCFFFGGGGGCVVYTDKQNSFCGQRQTRAWGCHSLMTRQNTAQSKDKLEHFRDIVWLYGQCWQPGLKNVILTRGPYSSLHFVLKLRIHGAFFPYPLHNS